MVGSAGFILHIGFALLASLELGAAARGTGALITVACVMTVVLAVLLYTNVGHNRAHPLAVSAVAVPFGAALGLLPMSLRLALPKIVPALDWDVGVLVVYAFLGPPRHRAISGHTIAVLGLENQQAIQRSVPPRLQALRTPLHVHPDGRIEAWAIGKDDALDPTEEKLIDHFEW